MLHVAKNLASFGVFNVFVVVVLLPIDYAHLFYELSRDREFFAAQLFAAVLTSHPCAGAGKALCRNSTSLQLRFNASELNGHVLAFLG